MPAPTAMPHTQFDNPDALTAAEPPEHRGLSRDEVRLLVAAGDGLAHARFSQLPSFLNPGDLLVVNNSATVAAELDARHRGTNPVVVHAATELDDKTWVVEIRSAPDAAKPVLDAEPTDVVDIDAATRLTLVAPYATERSFPTGLGNRLWRARVDGSLHAALERNGRPISYGYLTGRFPLEDYQTVFGTRPGSAEMPSAGRPFTHELVTRLVSSGIGIAAVTLHTGVSSQDAGEPPQRERFEVTPAAARMVNVTKAGGGRVIAVGTTVTRALESATGRDGLAAPAAGWTDRVISAEDPARLVDGLISGWHNPDASHLLLVESVAGERLTEQAYAAAFAHGYLWHEFGDSCLLLP
ncbi:MAG: S-adenosylmethionine:tRNA ribosyltransferase-isomerase [Actinomycetota bacterium]|nr:S-adenosylmethionine:tRNA ribosyltransferase-isomerase [Actinomycetota bacterium]